MKRECTFGTAVSIALLYDGSLFPLIRVHLGSFFSLDRMWFCPIAIHVFNKLQIVSIEFAAIIYPLSCGIIYRIFKKLSNSKISF